MLPGSTASGSIYLDGSANADLVAWYRNPSAAGKNSLRIAYPDADSWKSVQPDFVFVERDTTGALRPSILDPHGIHLSDAMPKLLALADYAEAFGDAFLRIDSMAALKQPKAGEPAVLGSRRLVGQQHVCRLPDSVTHRGWNSSRVHDSRPADLMPSEAPSPAAR